LGSSGDVAISGKLLRHVVDFELFFVCAGCKFVDVASYLMLRACAMCASCVRHACRYSWTCCGAPVNGPENQCLRTGYHRCM
jgi:hypothetical protein